MGSAPALRGLVMGRLGQLLNVDPWVAHSAGLFEECGKAVLYRHAPDHYRAMLRAAGSDAELLTLEHAGFGVSHDALGAALCESWGVAAAAVGERAPSTCSSRRAANCRRSCSGRPCARCRRSPMR